MKHKSNKDEQCHFKFITKLFIKGFSILTFMLNQLIFIIEQLSGQTFRQIFCFFCNIVKSYFQLLSLLMYCGIFFSCLCHLARVFKGLLATEALTEPKVLR